MPGPTRAQNPRRAEAVRRRHVQTPDRHQPWGERYRRPGCILRAQRAGLGWPLPEGLTDETLEDRLYPPPAVASKERRPRLDWATVQPQAAPARGRYSCCGRSIAPPTPTATAIVAIASSIAPGRGGCRRWAVSFSPVSAGIPDTVYFLPSP
jgi:hypothetical protein